MYTKHNYFMNTEATFTRCDAPATSPDFVSDSGSSYWYTEEGVIRESNHWGRAIASCNWFIEGEARRFCELDTDGTRAAFAPWSAFEMLYDCSVYIIDANGECVDIVHATTEMMHEGRIVTEYGECAFSANGRMTIRIN